MIYQTDSEFSPDIAHFGCYFMSLIYSLNQRFGIPILDHKVIEAIYQAERADGDMGAEAFIESPQGVCDGIVPGRVTFLGKFPAEYECGPGEFEIQCWYNPKTDFHHFVAPGYDPIEGGSRTLREGHLESKRIFKEV